MAAAQLTEGDSNMARTHTMIGLGSLAAAGLLALAGCATTDKAEVTSGAVNDICPISGRRIAANGPTVEFQGKTVGFCTPGCVSPWDKMSYAEKNAFVTTYE
jgi:hypothetical protein